MTRALRTLAWCGAALAGVALLAVASALLTLASLGVFARPSGAWTTEVAFAGVRTHVNVVGLVRLATLPGTAYLLDGRTMDTAGGTLRFARDGNALRVTCAPCRVRHPDLASVPVQFRSLALEAQRADDTVDAALVVDTVRVPLTARLRASSIDLAWQLPSTELAALYKALGEAVPEAAFARIEGTVQAHGALTLPSGRGDVRWSAEDLEVGGLGTESLQYGWFRFACGQPNGSAQLTISGDGEKAWTAGDAMGPYLAAAVLAAEDQRFHVHAGYDEHAIAGLLSDLENGRPKRGASTITQQLARTLFTGGERTALRKLRELLYAIEMERTLGKGRILELYLNTVDWGPGLCGARAAARAYFGKPPARLTALEAAWLAGVLRNPRTAWEQQFAARQPDRARATQLVTQMRDWPKRERTRFAAQPLAFAPAARAKASERSAQSAAARARHQVTGDAAAALTAPAALRATRR
ncbi:MAG TPA: biosynthetic peptidoglycan transglycosylase [Burkholderiaceae bacterium]|nr:biosynthetic peptidoglycan transglycosylase [Burkholderiaceae bacterium]